MTGGDISDRVVLLNELAAILEHKNFGEVGKSIGAKHFRRVIANNVF